MDRTTQEPKNAFSARAFLTWLALLAAPLLLVLLWSTCLQGDAYVTFAYARNLAAGRKLTFGLTVAGSASTLCTPLYVAILALFDGVGIPLHWASLALGALGWGTAAFALYTLCQTQRRPIAAIISALIIALNPLTVSSLGTETPWLLALPGFAVVLALKHRWRTLGCVLALAIWSRFDWTTLGLAAVMLIAQWIEEQRFPLRSGLIVVIAALPLAAVASLPGSPLSLGSPSLPSFEYWRQLLAESDLYWIWLPIAGLGLYSVRQKSVWAVLLWCTVSLLEQPAAARAGLVLMSALLAGLGIDWGVGQIAARELAHRERLRSHSSTLTACLALLVALPLGVAQASSLVHRHQSCPDAAYDIERQAGDWLASHCEPGATILGSARVGYLSGQQAVLWDGRASDSAGMSAILDALSAISPQYCVSRNTIAWNWLARSDWLLDRYEPIRRFEAAYTSASPLTVWRYRPSEYDRGEFRPADVSLPGGVRLVGLRYWPERIEPGEAIYATLSFQAARPISGAIPTIVRVTSPLDGKGWAQQNTMTPHSIPIDWWQTGQVVSERFVLTTSVELPIGAYYLDLSVPGSGIDGFALGYVAVPWQGTLDGTTRVEARFGDEIALLAYQAPGTAAADQGIDVTLFWEASLPPRDDYTVFVHLVDAGGQWIAGHDGPPMNGRYPTQAWIPEETVPDVHHLSIEPGTPEGFYLLQAGMYTWPELERLPVWDRHGVEQTSRVLALQEVEVR
jgi:hypothetical protein